MTPARPQRGRPKLFTGAPISVRLTPELHDRLSIEAIRREVTLADVIRERLNHEPPTD